jgi:hypothetical protein
MSHHYKSMIRKSILELYLVFALQVSHPTSPINSHISSTKRAKPAEPAFSLGPMV